MANAIYPKYKEALLNADANVDMGAGTVKITLIDTAIYTYSAAHDFEDDLSGIIDVAETLGTKTLTDGTFDSADPTWTAVSGATVEAIVIYIDTGTPATSRLICYIDTGQTGLPFTPNGGDVTINVDGAGWFTL